MLFRSTPSPPQVHLSVSDLSPPRSPGFTAELNAPCVLRRIRTMRRRFGDRTEPEPTGSGPNQGSGRFGYYFRYYFGYLTTRVRVVNSGPGYPLTSLGITPANPNQSRPIWQTCTDQGATIFVIGPVEGKMEAWMSPVQPGFLSSKPDTILPTFDVIVI